MVRAALPAYKPFVTYALLGITITFFLLQMLSQSLFNGNDILALYLMKINEAIEVGQYWRLITPVLLHGSIMHIGFNMYALFIIGPGLERFYGHGRYLALYLLAGLAGNVASFIFSPNPSLGASTAIFGLIAAQGIFIFRNRFLFGENARAVLTNIIVIIVINLVLGLSPGIDNWGHLGGLVGGLTFAWLAGPVLKITGLAPAYRIEDQRGADRAWLVALIELAVILAIVFALLAL
jgi:rhomboid protease GluP